MQIIPVLDLWRGVAVHARGGDRSQYRPVRSVLCPAAGDPLALVRAYRETLGAAECYVADLDAIQGGPIQRSVLRELAQSEPGFPGSLLVDAGTHQAARSFELLACGASAVVVGLESLQAFVDLGAIVELAGAARVILSLDLRLGSPILHPAMRDARGVRPNALSLAAQAIEVGVRTLLVLDMGRVGTGCGVDLGLLENLRRSFETERLLAGGGVRSQRDLERMRDAGCDGALVASALHSGRIGPADLAALAGSRQSDTSASRYTADCP